MIMVFFIFPMINVKMNIELRKWEKMLDVTEKKSELNQE